jgi:hypothetical protein
MYSSTPFSRLKFASASWRHRIGVSGSCKSSYISFAAVIAPPDSFEIITPALYFERSSSKSPSPRFTMTGLPHDKNSAISAGTFDEVRKLVANFDIQAKIMGF